MQDTEHRDRLSEALRALARDEDTPGASDQVRARLLAEVGAIARARRHAHIKAYAIAATLVLAVGLPVWQVAQRGPVPAMDMAEIATEFFPLRYSAVPFTSSHVVRIEVPEAAMASFGLQPPGVDPMNTVLADVVIGEDGLARAVRFVLTTPPQEQQ
jgi:hypothetical protein